jgi:hypothetical protein
MNAFKEMAAMSPPPRKFFNIRGPMSASITKATQAPSWPGTRSWWLGQKPSEAEALEKVFEYSVRDAKRRLVI